MIYQFITATLLGVWYLTMLIVQANSRGGCWKKDYRLFDFTTDISTPPCPMNASYLGACSAKPCPFLAIREIWESHVNLVFLETCSLLPVVWLNNGLARGIRAGEE